jgi:hypothetical protein
MFRSGEPKRALAEIMEAQIAQDRLAGYGDTQPTSVLPLNNEAVEQLDALIFSSKNGGRSHVVSVHQDAEGKKFLSCICRAMLNLDRNPAGCWATKAARAIIGLPEEA